MFLVDPDLAALEDFFMLNMRRDSWEIDQILSDYERGKYSTPDDFGNALFIPMKRLEISMRAVYYELTSIIEFEIRSLASRIYLSFHKDNLKKPKDFLEIPFSKVINYFNKANINLDNIEEYNTVKYIINIANSYKHRKGLKRLNEMKKVPDYNELDAGNVPKATENILNAINDTREFLIELKSQSKDRIDANHMR